VLGALIGSVAAMELPLREVVRGRIKAFRREKGLTQEELCERAEISVDAVNRIENGTRVPTIDTLEKIATGLGVSLTDLLQMPSAKPTKVAAPVRRVVTLIENEPAEIQQGVEEIVRAALKLTKSKRSKRR